jgi:uncharacterized protein (DUF2267 family)
MNIRILDAEQLVRTVFKVLALSITKGEAKEITRILTPI